jgi:UDP-glucose 4-epimerase
MKRSIIKVLITGGAGFIGSNVADRLIDEGYEVVVVDNLVTGKVENLNKKIKFYKYDIREKDLIDIFRAEKPDYVIHDAAQLGITISMSDPVYDTDVNLKGGVNVFNCCKESKVKKVIFASSAAVYGEQDYYPADEEHALKPMSPYGIAKMASEKYLNYYFKNFEMKYTALRYANVYGPRQDPFGEGGVVAIFSKKMIGGESPVINGDGRQTRDYVFVSDVVEANIKAIQSDYIGCINISTEIETAVNELFQILKKISKNNNIKENHGAANQSEQRRSSLGFKKAREILGWEPRVSIEKGLEITYEWFQKKMKP